MSVVVRMEMPKDCFECSFGIIDYTEGGVWCNALAQPSSGQREDCPIICSLPEGHGRLVDADALKEWFIEQIDYYKRFDGPNCSMMVSAYEAVCRVINDAPTIVPAEAERSET